MDSQQARIRFLFSKYLQNKCTVEELEELFEFIRKHPDSKIPSSVLDAEAHADLSNQPLPEELSHSIFLSLNKKLSGRDYLFEKTQRRFRAQHYLKVAAVFLVVIISAGVLYLASGVHSSITEVKTAFGQIREVKLPDGSLVTLNGNSSIQYAAHWDNEEVRRVKLTGEAFFKVMHLANHQKFHVLTSNSVVVEVLGTEFNVNDRRSRTQVMLQSGKIRLGIGGVESERQKIVMASGEYVEVNKANEIVARKKVDAGKYVSWKNHRLVFNDTPLEEILHLLEDNYGIVSVVNDDKILKEKFTAEYPSDNIEILLKALEKSFRIKYQPGRKRLIIGK